MSARMRWSRKTPSKVALRVKAARLIAAAYESVQRLAWGFFNESGVFLECCVDDARHVEVQIFGNLPAAIRESLLEAAIKLGSAVGYRSAGTVEFIYDRACEEFFFLGATTRLQVEHPVAELV